MQVPALVAELQRRAEEAGFPLSSENGTGALLAVLAAAVRPGGRICELGTGMGVGLGWLVSGLHPRTDVSVTTVENDPERSTLAQAVDWPGWVRFVVGDAVVELPRWGRFDLIFADAEGGKWYGLDTTISALGPGGMLVLDDLEPQQWRSQPEKDRHRQKMDEIRAQIAGRPDLVATELSCASGVLLAVRTSGD